MTVVFSAEDSTDPNSDTLEYFWDLDEDGQFDDGMADGSTVMTSWTYQKPGARTVTLLVDDQHGGTSTATVKIMARKK